MDSSLELFCDVDDFCHQFEPGWKKKLLTDGEYKRQRERSLRLSEIMTILIYFHQSQYRNFKTYYKTGIKPAIKTTTIFHPQLAERCIPFHRPPQTLAPNVSVHSLTIRAGPSLTFFSALRVDNMRPDKSCSLAWKIAPARTCPHSR